MVANDDPIKVLLIEPNGELCELTAHILCTAGYQIERLPEGDDPVAFADQIKPQVIVIRVRPLEPQDQEIVASLVINPRTRAIPVVVIHSLDQEGRVVASLPNVKEILPVPYDINALRAAVTRALEELPPAEPHSWPPLSFPNYG